MLTSGGVGIIEDTASEMLAESKGSTSEVEDKQGERDESEKEDEIWVNELTTLGERLEDNEEDTSGDVTV